MSYKCGSADVAGDGEGAKRSREEQRGAGRGQRRIDWSQVTTATRDYKGEGEGTRGERHTCLQWA